MDAVIAKLMKNLAANNMKPFYAGTKRDVVPIVSELLRDRDTVAVGGSVSLFESGVIEHLRCGRYNFIDRYEPGLSQVALRAVFVKSLSADAYLCSSNAVTENGELYNVDGNANRIAAISYGPRSVIMVIGRNKIVPDLNGAVERVKTIAAPLNCERLESNTYCRGNGSCISTGSGAAGITYGCGVPGRLCCSYLISGRQREKDRIKVIIVGESLGY